MYRVCSKCKKEKPLTDYYKCKDKYHYDCKDCYKLCRSKNGHLFRTHNKRKKAISNNISNLSNGYVKQQLKKAGFLMDHITHELIELKKQQIILNRTIKWQNSKM